MMTLRITDVSDPFARCFELLVVLFIAALRGEVVNLEGCRHTSIRNALNFSLSIIVLERCKFGLIVVCL